MQIATDRKEVAYLIRTTATVDKQITQLRDAITKNTVANQGLAMEKVRMLEHQNHQRKKWLKLNRGYIADLEAKTPKSKLRSSFITPDGPKHRGDRNTPFKSINQLKAERPVDIPIVVTPTIVVPKPSNRKANLPPKDMLRISDQLRTRANIEGGKRAEIVKRAVQAKDDHALVQKGQMSQVIIRRQAELKKRREHHALRAKRSRDAKRAQMVRRALGARKAAEARAQREAAKMIASKRSPIKQIPQQVHSPVKQIPQQVHRARPPSAAQKVAQDNLISDRRVTPTTTPKKTDKNRIAEEINNKFESAIAYIYKEVEQLELDYSPNGSGRRVMREVGALIQNTGKTLHDGLTKYVNGTWHIEPQELDDFAGQLAAKIRQEGIAIIKRYYIPKAAPTSGPMVPRNINIPIAKQVQLTRRVNRVNHAPVRTQQIQARGMGGLFPALRSSMQGVLKR